ncbi:MAG: hypothetical protein AB8B79_23850 [Granulosicoccus sp.]
MINYNPIAESKHFIVLERYQRDSEVNENYQSEDALACIIHPVVIFMDIFWSPNITRVMGHTK